MTDDFNPAAIPQAQTTVTNTADESPKDTIESILKDLGITVPDTADRIIDLLFKALAATKSLVPADKQSDLAAIEDAVIEALKAGRSLEEGISTLVKFIEK